MVNYFKNILSLCVLICVTFGARATEETYSVRKNSGFITEGAYFDIIDGRFAELTYGDFYTKSTELVVKFGIEERDYFDLIDGFTSISAQLRIDQYSPIGELENQTTQTTTISYSPEEGSTNTIDLSAVKVSGGHRYRITIEGIILTGISVIPANVFIEAELSVDRYYELNTTAPALGANFIKYNPETNAEEKQANVNFSSTAPFNPQELEVYWSYVEGAEEYELEWTWVDDYEEIPVFTLKDFERNNTRILTKAQSYRIPFVFAKGYLIYRVRAVGRWIDNDLQDVDKRYYGNWTAAGEDLNTQTTTPINWPHYIKIDADHEYLKNWQYQAVYAEEGKKKEIISYFDGSLRNRQTVTRINSNNEAIVGENVYDNQGRSAVQILPAPVGNSALRYYNALNKNVPEIGEEPKVYTHYDFDWDNLTGECRSAASAMSTSSGASNYYSSVPDRENNWQDYVPDAGGFPFVQVEYTPDNTGRIRRQSGVGTDFQIDGEHTTQYFYLQPSQEELDRLFGYHVGYKSHYKKNLVIDANGQVSVSYIDPQGRVVATALAGVNDDGAGNYTTNLLSLDEHNTGNHAYVSRDLLNKLSPTGTDTDNDDNRRLVTGAHGAAVDALSFSTQYGSSDNTPYDFDYSVTTGVFTDPCTPDGVAYPFAYDLSINLRNDCGENMFDDNEAIAQLITGTEGTDYIGSTGTTVNFNDLIATLPAGAYSLNKVIKVNEETLERHLEHYMANLKPECRPEFMLSQRDCFDEIPADSPYYMDELFDMNSCLSQRTQLLYDMLPEGQYGATDGEDLTSIFSTENALPFGEEPETGSDVPQNWQNPYTAYVNNDGSAAIITDITYDDVEEIYSPELTEDGEAYFEEHNHVLPGHLLNLSDFLEYWQSNWAESLIQYHPEYNYYRYKKEICSRTGLGTSATILVDDSPVAISSETYDNALLLINTYESAKNGGDGNILGKDFISTVFSATDDQTIRVSDPYFNIDYSASPDPDAPLIHNATYFDFKRDLIDEILSEYKPPLLPSSPYTPLTLWQVAIKTVICPSDFDGECTIPSDQAMFEISLTTEQKDEVWNLYKNLYVSEKRKIDQFFLDMYAIANNFYNGFIGTETAVSPAIISFAHYPDYFLLNPVNMIAMRTSALELSAGGGDDDYPWMMNEHVSEFQEKEQRYVPTYDGYDPGVPEDVVLSTMTESVDGQIYALTGKCSLEQDLEFLLSGLAQRDLIASGSVVNSDNLPEFTPELYVALGGTVVTDGGTLTTVSTAQVGANLEISFTDADGGTMHQVILNAPSPAVDGFSWSVIDELSMLYYVPNSFSDYAESRFEILAKTVIDDNYTELVLTGSIPINIHDCHSDATGGSDINCDKDERFAGDLKALFSAMYESGSLVLTPIGGVNAVETLGGWYAGSVLATVVNDNPFGPVGTIVTSPTGISLNATLLASQVNISFTDGVPTDIEVLTGAHYNAETGILTLYYLNPSGEGLTFTANVRIRNGNKLPDLTCMCDEELALAKSLEVFFNQILASDVILPLGDAALEVNGDLGNQIFSGYNESFTSVEEINRLSGSQEIVVRFSDNDCIFRVLSADGTGVDPSDITAVFDITVDEAVAPYPFTISGYGVKPDGSVISISIVPDQIPLGCFKTVSCSDCIPFQRQPLSCTEKFADYNLLINALNAPLLAADPDLEDEMFKVYSVEEFCAAGYAYSTDAYLQYLTLFGIASLEDDYYISLANFSTTDLNDYYLDENDGTPGSSPDGTYDVVADYYAYENTPGAEHLSWIEYVNTVYLPMTDICPPQSLPFLVDMPVEFPCEMYAANIDTINQKNQEEIYYAQLADNFKSRYLEAAVSSLVETFNVAYSDREYHYTLYYYDQAGNLIQTVPPKGVDRIDASINAIGVKEARGEAIEEAVPENTADDVHDFEPVHSFETQYRYNSLNQLVWQNTPDGGISRFGYDDLGRLVVSQNGKQKAYENDEIIGEVEQFSYTRYDDLGRIIEVGEMTLTEGYSFNEDGKFVIVSAGGTATLVDVQATNFPLNLGANLKAREEVTITQYDVLSGIAATEFEDYASTNTRNRITGVFYYENYADDLTSFDNATFYDYDVHGNVKELIQANLDPDLVEIGHAYKKTKYTYDLVSGNVKEVVYQDDQKDQFIHEYEYDADNRITHVRTSQDEVIWEQDAKYFYYDHGPLARTEIGDKKVQASDFAYTIQGWLKGVNSENLSVAKDQGKDAALGINRMNGKDVFGFSLQYFNNDYTARHGNDFLAYSDGTLLADNLNLYNGNIREMYTASTYTNETYRGTSHTGYTYDQLNRIREMRQEELTAGSTPAHGTGITGGYHSEYTYDQNGNLDVLRRWSKTAGGDVVPIDDFKYHYKDGTNQLLYVHDAIGAAVLDDDLADQSIYHVSDASSNYGYDEIGQLIKDKQEEIAEIQWKVTGKVHKIIREEGSAKSNLEFVYDAMGNRIMKIETANNGALIGKTYYVRDAQGNCMSIYTYSQGRAASSPVEFMLTERSIYGSSRVGTENVNLLLETTGTLPDELPENLFVQTVGDKRYELANHLGNVLQVITDRKLTVTNSGSTCVSCGELQTAVDSYIASGGAITDMAALTGSLNTQLAVALNEIQYNAAFEKCQLLSTSIEINGGNNRYVDFGNQTQYQLGTNDFTVEAWINYDEYGPTHAYHPILSNQDHFWDGTTRSFTGLYFGKRGTTLEAYVGDGVGVAVVRTPLPSLDEWHHVVFERIGNDPNDFKLYVDGVLVPTTTGIHYGGLTHGDISVDGVEELKIGSRAGSFDNRSFDGKIKNVRLFDRQMGLSEVVANYNGGCDPALSNHENLVLWAKLNEGEGTTVTDYSGFAETGNMIGSVNWASEYNSLSATCLTPSMEAFCTSSTDPADAYIAYVADVVSQSDYYPFGMMLPNRNESTPEYRYGFNGMEKDDEVTAQDGTSYDFGARFYNPRVGRFLSVDPKSISYPFMSTYCYAANSPIKFIDINGEGPIIPFQSFTASEEMRSYIVLYNNGDMTWSDFKAKIEYFQSMPFTAVRHANHARDQFSLNNLGDEGNMHQGGGKLITDKEYDSNFKIPGPDVAYEDGVVDDLFIHFVLIEEDDMGNWMEVDVTVLDQDAFLKDLKDINEDLNYWKSELDDIDRQIERKKAFIAEAERQMKEDHSGSAFETGSYGGMDTKFEVGYSGGMGKFKNGKAGAIAGNAQNVLQWTQELQILESKRTYPAVMYRIHEDGKNNLLEKLHEADPEGKIRRTAIENQ